MQCIVDEKFLAQVKEYRLSFTCEECGYFVPAHDVCGLLYPTTPHRAATFAALQLGDRVQFCKMWEARLDQDTETTTTELISLSK